MKKRKLKLDLENIKKEKSHKSQEADKKFNDFYNNPESNITKISKISFNDSIKIKLVENQYKKNDFFVKKELSFAEAIESENLENRLSDELENNLQIAKYNKEKNQIMLKQTIQEQDDILLEHIIESWETEINKILENYFIEINKINSLKEKSKKERALNRKLNYCWKKYSIMINQKFQTTWSQDKITNELEITAQFFSTFIAQQMVNKMEKEVIEYSDFSESSIDENVQKKEQNHSGPSSGIRCSNDFNDVKSYLIAQQLQQYTSSSNENDVDETNKAWGEKNERERREKVANAFESEKSNKQSTSKGPKL